jgi:hypothetical protein
MQEDRHRHRRRVKDFGIADGIWIFRISKTRNPGSGDLDQ